MYIDEIRANYNAGHYDYKIDIPKKVPDGYVFDENLSVKRNRELVVEHNKRVTKLRAEKVEKQTELFFKLREDVIDYITEEYNLTRAQAEKVEAFTYTEKHSFMCDYFSFIDTFADFAESILGTN
jgi:hypothetical protein